MDDPVNTPAVATLAVVAGVLVPKLATTKLLSPSTLEGVKVVVAAPLVLVVLAVGDTVPVPVLPTVQLIGRPDSSVVVVPPTVTVAV
jgi:hypothetical protein